MEFLCSFLRRHFEGKPVMASRNVGCSLRLIYIFLVMTHSLFLPNRTISQTHHWTTTYYNYLIDFRFLCHDLHKKRLNDCVSSSQ